MVGKFHRQVRNPFICKDGTSLNTMLEFARYFENISDDEFNHHVNESKDDFAMWLEHELGETELAKKLNEIKDKKEYELVFLRSCMNRL